MTFAQPLWLLVALVVLAAGAGLIVFSERKRRQKLHRLVAARLLPALAPANDRRRYTGHVLWLGALLCLLVALARPQGGLLETTARVQGANLLISVDVSRSMLADDLPPNRLFRAKLALQDFAENRPGDRLGLLAFAGSAFLQVPPTLDRNAFSDTLMALEPGVVAGRGTNLAAAIREATKAVPDDTRSSAIILLSDGGNLSGDTLAAAGAAADAGITVFTVGVGTPEGTLLRDANGTRILGPGGEPVVTKLEPETLIAVAEMTGGVYVPLGATGSGLAEIGSRLEALAETVAESRVHQSREEFFQYPLATAALLLLVEAWLLPLRRKRLPVPGSASATVACLLLTALALPGSEALAQAPDEAAARQADDPQVPSAQTQPERPPPEVQKALEPYVRRLARDPTDARAHFNVGTILMEAGFAAEARGYLEKAVTFGNPETQARAYFNLGHLAARHAWPLHEAMPEWASLSETFDPQLDAIARQTDAAKRLGEEVYAAATDFATPAMLRRADVPDESTIRSVLQGVENAAQQLGQIREMVAAELQAARELEEAWSTVDAYFEAAGYLDEELELPAEDSVRWIQERRKEFPTGETIQKLETVTSTAADLSRETDAPPIARLHVEMEDLAERLRELLPDPPQPESKEESESEDNEESPENNDSGESEGEESESDEAEAESSPESEQGESGGQDPGDAEPGDGDTGGDPGASEEGQQEPSGDPSAGGGTEDEASANGDQEATDEVAAGEQPGPRDDATRPGEQPAPPTEDEGTGPEASNSTQANGPDPDEAPAEQGDAQSALAEAQEPDGEKQGTGAAGPADGEAAEEGGTVVGGATSDPDEAEAIRALEIRRLLEEWDRRGNRVLPFTLPQSSTENQDEPVRDW